MNGLVEGIEGRDETNKNEPSGRRSRGTNISSKNVVRTARRVSRERIEAGGERTADAEICGAADTPD